MIPKPLDLEPLRHICHNLREQSRREIFASRWDDDPDKLAEDLMSYAGAFSWYGEAGEPIYAGGAIQAWPGHWRMWGFGTDRLREAIIPATKFIRRKMLPAVVRLGAKRIQSTCIAGDVEVEKWLKLLGATQEAVLTRYGKNGEDFTQWTWNLDVR